MMLQGRAAVVTGSTNGFCDAGMIEKLKRDLAERHRVKVAYSAADMTKAAEIRQMIAEAARQLGSVDILVNNAGIQHVAPVEDFPDDEWDEIIAKQTGRRPEQEKIELMREKQPMLADTEPEQIGARGLSLR